MPTQQPGPKSVPEPKSVRASVSLSPEVYRALERLAKEKNVSAAWLIRDGRDKYLAEHSPGKR